MCVGEIDRGLREVGMRSHAASRGRGTEEIKSPKLEEEGKPSHRWEIVDLLGVILSN